MYQELTILTACLINHCVRGGGFESGPPQLGSSGRKSYLDMLREKKDPGDRFDDEHCLDHFGIEENTIIRTKKSTENGAAFLNTSGETSMSRCLHECCSTPGCNVAVFGGVEEDNCFLFDCGSPDDFKCRFSTSDMMYTSAILNVDRHKFDLTSAARHRYHADELSQLRPRLEEAAGGGNDAGGGGGGGRQKCGQYEYQCYSGECLAIYDLCNGIPQCQDGSDEMPEVCQGLDSSTTQGPPRHIHLRPDMDPPGVNNNNGPASTAFRHKTNGIQVGGGDPRLSYNGGIVQQPSQQMMLNPAPAPPNGYYYPQQAGLVPNMPVYQQPMRLGPFQYAADPRYGQQQPMAPPQPAPPLLDAGGGPQLPGYVREQAQTKENAGKENNKKAGRKTKPGGGRTVKPWKPEYAATTTVKGDAGASGGPTTTISDEFEIQLMEKLKDELRVVYTPGIAVFSLVLGIIITIILVAVMVCRFRKAAIGLRRRNLAHDADGDYLVNGMYL